MRRKRVLEHPAGRVSAQGKHWDGRLVLLDVGKRPQQCCSQEVRQAFRLTTDVCKEWEYKLGVTSRNAQHLSGPVLAGTQQIDA